MVKIPGIAIYGIAGFVFGLLLIVVCFNVMSVNLAEMVKKNDSFVQLYDDPDAAIDDLNSGYFYLKLAIYAGFTGGAIQCLSPFLLICKLFKLYCFGEAIVFSLLVVALTLPLVKLTQDIREDFFDCSPIENPIVMKTGASFNAMVCADIIYTFSFVGVYIMYWSNHNLRGTPTGFSEDY